MCSYVRRLLTLHSSPSCLLRGQRWRTWDVSSTVWFYTWTSCARVCNGCCCFLLPLWAFNWTPVWTATGIRNHHSCRPLTSIWALVRDSPLRLPWHLSGVLFSSLPGGNSLVPLVVFLTSSIRRCQGLDLGPPPSSLPLLDSSSPQRLNIRCHSLWWYRWEQ